MLAEISTVTMKMLSNKKGIALVILIIAMTLIAVLGAGIVSFMGAKHKSYPFQVNSYRALNIANAGVECAIRYISDSLGDATSTYFQNLSSNDDIGSINFASGTFTISRNFNYTIANDNIDVTATFSGTSRRVRLSNFRRYLAALTLVSDPSWALGNRKPSLYPLLSDVLIPIINNNNQGVTLDRLNIFVTFSTSAARHLKNIYLGTSINDKSITAKVYDGGSGLVINHATPNVDIPLVGNRSINTDAIKWCILEFDSSENPSGTYDLTFFFGTAQSKIKFSVP
ncbi:MAG: hypothetical protein NTV31_17655 [Bacteroidia bacterium]|nr:hypothetical protein [Bacteroidia bacterium]